ncbi:Dispatched-like protein 1 [Dirofilaria immitis]|nr:Dispatched-like protein 1 [Dirofilaria immitis]
MKFAWKGFETRTTFLSNQRLALESLIDIAAGKDHIKSLHKREITHNDLQYEDNRFANRKDIRKNETQLEMPINACQQYFVLGTMISYKITLLLSKLIFKVSSFNDLFSMHTMQRLCAIDSIIDSEINLNDLNATDIKRLPFSFNLPYYTMCLNMDMLSNLNSCSSLNSDSINLFKSLVLSCQSDNMSIQCQLPIATQLSNMIFQKSNGMVDTIKPFYFAVVLPIIQSNDGYTNLQFYSNLLQKLQEDYKDDDKLKLMGAQFGVKEGLFVDKLRGDVQLGVFAIILVVLIILLYTGSIFYTFCITVSLILSIGVAFFVYTDASKKWSPVLLNCDLNNAKEENSDKEELMEYHRRQVISGLSDALSHAAISMWVTSATTAVAFFANLASNIIVLRCFGIYAGTLMMINYVLVMIILPAAIVFLRSNHPYEWFDENAASLFDFSINQHPKMNIIAIWGIKPTTHARYRNKPDKSLHQLRTAMHHQPPNHERALNLSILTSGSSLIPNDKGSLNMDVGFADVLANHLLEFQAFLKNVSRESNSHAKGNLWLDEFIEWTNLNTTSRGCQLFGEKNLKYQRLAN